MANGYGETGTPISAYVYPDRAAGGLFGTLDDMAAFAAAGMTNLSNRRQGVLDGETVQLMYTPASDITGYYQLVFDAYGFGHFIEYLSPEGGGKDKVKAVFHGGQGSGWMTDFHSIPETGEGIVILSNSQRTWPGFAYILSDWAGRLGYKSIGMGVIVAVQKAAWISIAVIFFIFLLLARRLFRGISSGRMLFAPFSKKSTVKRIVQFMSALVLGALFIRVVSLDYWFIDSVLPIATHWLNGAVLSLSVVLLVSALFPLEQDAPRERSVPDAP